MAAGSGLRTLAVDIGARTAISALAEPDGSVVSRIHGSGGLSGLAQVAGASGRVSRMAGDAGDEATVADAQDLGAQQLCVLVADASHGVEQGTGNCVDLPT